MRTLFRKYQAYFLQDNDQLLLKTTNRIFSTLFALISGYFVNWMITVYTYILVSVALDIVFYKFLKLKESSYKKPEFFYKKDFTGEEYDCFKLSLLNARIIVLILTHSLILFDVNLPWVNYLPFISIICIFAMFFATIYVGHRYGYHTAIKNTKNWDSPSISHAEYDRIGDGLPGWRMGTYTGDEHHRG